MKTCSRCESGSYELTRPTWAGYTFTEEHWPNVCAAMKEHKIEDEPAINWYGPTAVLLFPGLYHCNECGHSHPAPQK